MELEQGGVNIWTLVHYYLENECGIEKPIVSTRYPSLTLFNVINVIKDTK
jgi:hypothetical protein